MAEVQLGCDAHISAVHMVLGKDLNPHDTLFAGQAASYMIECGFLAVQNFLQTSHIVCAGLERLSFLQPVHKNDSIRIASTIIYAGTASVGVYICMTILPVKEKAAECFVTFAHIDEASGRPLPHYVKLAALETSALERQQLYCRLKECC